MRISYHLWILKTEGSNWVGKAPSFLFMTFIVSTGKMQQEPKDSEACMQAGGQLPSKYCLSSFLITRAKSYYQLLHARPCAQCIAYRISFDFHNHPMHRCCFNPQFQD